MQLTPHFALSEFTVSRIAAVNGIDNTPDAASLANLKSLAKVLETLRADLNRPVVITSGFRCDALNRAAGGAEESAHLTGRAADCNIPGMTPKAFAQMLVAHKDRYPFDKVILEFPDAAGGGWVHVQIAKPGAKPRGEVYTIRKGTGYMRGIV